MLAVPLGHHLRASSLALDIDLPGSSVSPHVGTEGTAGGGCLGLGRDRGDSPLRCTGDLRRGSRGAARTEALPSAALSSAVACDATWEPKTGVVSGKCSAPLTSIVVDADDTKTGHFRQWATNKKSDPATCELSVRFEAVQLPAPLKPDVPQSFTAAIPFRVCGRAREDGAAEQVRGTVVLLGTPGALRIRARVEHFRREAYRIGPRFTDGWLARVQALSGVVAEEGVLELTLFAAPEGWKAPSPMR